MLLITAIAFGHNRKRKRSFYKGLYNSVKREGFRAFLIRKSNLKYRRGELCSPAGDRRSPLQTHINFGRGIVSSADLCYNEANEKPPSEREAARVA